MRARVIAISLALVGMAGGVIVFFNWETATVVQLYDEDWEFVDKNKCDLNPCALNACVAAQNHIDDAGLPCVTRLADCPMRINARIRAAATANGVTLGPQTYQQLRFGVERCAADGGGFSFGIALDDAGWPMLASVAQVTLPCVRAPLDGGTNCFRSGAFYGRGNVFPVSLATGTQCEPCACIVFFGDNPETDL